MTKCKCKLLTSNIGDNCIRDEHKATVTAYSVSQSHKALSVC